MTIPGSQLRFPDATPVAPQGLGGLIRDHFSNSRMSATVGWHGGLVGVSYWGRQHLGAPHFFSGALETAWTKLFRPCLALGGRRHYLPLSGTRLYPFGLAGLASVAGVEVAQELLLLPDALVQRFSIERNPKRLPVSIEMFHQEKIVAAPQANRTWEPFAVDAGLNAAIASCRDRNSEVYRGGDSLSQQDLGLEVRDAPDATTWIGVGCGAPMRMRRSHNGFKLYFSSEPVGGRSVSFFVAFADSREALALRLAALAQGVDAECGALIDGYERRLRSHPAISVGDAVLDSAFNQYPEVIRTLAIHDRPGAVRAGQPGYWVWGWDGMMAMQPCLWGNEAGSTADILRFFHATRHQWIGLPLQFTTAFEARLKAPFAAQAQFIAGLYQYVAVSGDLELAREVMPTCRFILDRCREREVHGTGLVAGHALWPDFPEAMDEDGDDVSTLNNSLLYQGLRAMEHLAAALGDVALAVECRGWAGRLRAGFAQHLWDEERGYFLSSCSARDLSPRRHHPGQAILWLTPFARELVAHAPGRIAAFMDHELRSARCLLTLPHSDPAWMADGNQLGSSFPAADLFYVNLHKLVGDAGGLDAWLGDVAWFWRFHTAPEAFTPEAENEDVFGPDNHGGKQLQAVSAWYACAFQGVAGLDADHEGLTVTPWGGRPVAIRGLRLRGARIDLAIRGRGPHLLSLRLNGRPLPAGCRKIPWSALAGARARLEVVRTATAPRHPVIVRADGLRVEAVETAPGRLAARIAGGMSGEVAVEVAPGSTLLVDGQALELVREPATGCVSIPYAPGGEMRIEIAAAARGRKPLRAAATRTGR